MPPGMILTMPNGGKTPKQRQIRTSKKEEQKNLKIKLKNKNPGRWFVWSQSTQIWSLRLQVGPPTNLLAFYLECRVSKAHHHSFSFRNFFPTFGTPQAKSFLNVKQQFSAKIFVSFFFFYHLLRHSSSQFPLLFFFVFLVKLANCCY